MEPKTPQQPAEGICEMASFRGVKFFRIPCKCQCENELTLDIEVEDASITAHIYTETTTNDWRQRLRITYDESWIVLNLKSLYNDLYNRIAVALTALFKGYVQTQTYIILSEQQALNFSQVLKDSVDEFRRQLEAEQEEIAKTSND